MRSWMLVVVMACSGSSADTQPSASSHDEVEQVHRGALANLEGTARSMAVLGERVDGWDDATRSEALEASAAVLSSCACSRVGLELPIALAEVARRHTDASIDPEFRGQWGTLRQGLDAHAELAALLAETDLPASGSDASCGGVDDALDALAEHTDGQWPMRTHLRGWRNALVVLESHVGDPAFRADVRGMVDDIGEVLKQRCPADRLGDCELHEPSW